VTPARRRRRTPPAALREQHAAVDDVAVVLDAAARFLEARSRSVAEVRRRLTSAGYRSSLVDDAIERLAKQGYLDDGAFARAWVASRDRARPRGERALRAELHTKGIDRSVIDEVLSERGEAAAAITTDDADAPDMASADEMAAQRLLEKHRRSLMREADPRRRRAKAYALLARNGFGPDVCRRVAASVGDADDEDDGESPTENPEP
jgi:regulatory protein